MLVCYLMGVAVYQSTVDERLREARTRLKATETSYETLMNKDTDWAEEVWQLVLLHRKVVSIWEKATKGKQ